MHGKGIYTWPNGDKYEGEWKDGFMEGNGAQTCANGKKYIGLWKVDIRLTGKYVWENHPENEFLFETALSESYDLTAKCIKIGHPSHIFSYNQLAFDCVVVKHDLSLTGKVRFGSSWDSFDGTINKNQIIIFVGSMRYAWSFKKID